MKKILSVVAMAIVVASASAQISRDHQPNKVQSQPNNHFGKRHHGKHEMFKALNLTDVQKKEMKANREAYRNKIAELKSHQDMTLREFNSKKAALDKEQKEKMQALLTPEQKNQLADMKLKREKEMKERADRRFEEMKTKLALSEDQVIKLKAQRQETEEKLKALRENETMAREEKHQQMKAIKDAAQTQRKLVLTADQLKKLEEMKAMHKQKREAVK